MLPMLRNRLPVAVEHFCDPGVVTLAEHPVVAAFDRVVFFYPVTTVRFFYISLLCEKSINERSMRNTRQQATFHILYTTVHTEAIDATNHNVMLLMVMMCVCYHDDVYLAAMWSAGQ